MKTLVVARYNENCTWIADLDASINKVIVQKGVDFPNLGREASSYLWFIISHYDKLQGDYYFVQGRPFDHCPGLYNELSVEKEEGFRWLGRGELFVSEADGTPHHGGLPVQQTYLEIIKNSHDPPSQFSFAPGAQFAVTAETIKQKPITFYTYALHILLCDEKRGAWCFERLWGEIFK